ncbi:HAD family hydrolase [Thermosynechococcaceae cyanobacterium Okahandja]
MSVTLCCQRPEETVCFANVAAVIFDKDGTLANSARYLYQLAQARLRRIAAIAPGLEEPLRRSFGLSGQHVQPQGLQAVGSRQENLIAAAAYLAGQGYGWIQAREIAETAFREADCELSPKAPFTPPYPGVIDLVQRLNAAGVALAVLSGDRTAEVEAFLATYQLNGFFQIAMGSDRPPAKPDPTPLKKICAELKIPPAQTIVIGDADADGLMAQRAAAAGCIGVTWGWYPPPPLSYCQCTVAAPSQIQILC